MSSAFPLPLIDLLREALQELEGESLPLRAKKTKRIHFLRQLITIINAANLQAGLVAGRSQGLETEQGTSPRFRSPLRRTPPQNENGGE